MKKGWRRIARCSRVDMKGEGQREENCKRTELIMEKYDDQDYDFGLTILILFS